MRKLFFTSFTWALLAASLLLATGSHAAVETNSAAASQDNIHYRISYKSKVDPLPLNQMHSWIIHVETLDGKPVEQAKIVIYGKMPMHKHDLPTTPVVSELGDGDYLAEGMKFSMLGLWKLWIQVQAGQYTDTVTFEIEL